MMERDEAEATGSRMLRPRKQTGEQKEIRRSPQPTSRKGKDYKRRRPQTDGRKRQKVSVITLPPPPSDSGSDSEVEVIRRSSALQETKNNMAAPMNSGVNTDSKKLTSEKLTEPTATKKPTIFFQEKSLAGPSKQVTSASKPSTSSGKDKKGRPLIQHHDDNDDFGQHYLDVPNGNTIVTPRTDKDIQQNTAAFLKYIELTKKLPSGVALDDIKIELCSGEYREGKDFKINEESLGKGNIAGNIKVVVDKKKKIKHALKIMPLSFFRVEEIQAWVDLNDTGICPKLYLFHLEGNNVLIHMEILEKAITLRDITDTHMEKLWSENQELAKLFSLYIFLELLDTVQKMHDKGWAHKDLHAGNAMLQEQDGSLKVKVLDFGQAQDVLKGSSENISSDVKKDYEDIVKMFSGLYTGDELIGTNMWELWKKKLEEMPEKHKLEIKEIKCPMDVQELKNSINKMKKHYMDEESLKRTVIQILFAEDKPMTGHDYNVNSEQADGVDVEKFNEETKKILEIRD